MPDQFTEVSNQSWGSRIGDSFKGILFGIILIPIAIILLWWNEGRAVKTAQGLKEGAAAVISVQADAVNPDNEGKLVHVTGKAAVSEAVSDPDFGISAEVLRLSRDVQMYQWEEKKESKTQDKLGGGQETVTTYKYTKTWTSDLINSDNFKHPEEHQNPTQMIADSDKFISQDATLGAFRLPENLIAQMTGDQPLPLNDQDIDGLPERLQSKTQIVGNAFYFGKDPQAPVVGDQKVSFTVLKPGVFSVIGKQMGDTFEPYVSKSGSEILRVESGDVSASLMFQHAESENTIFTWLLRLVGFILMAFGFNLIVGPISVFASVIPLLGNIVGAGTGFVAMLLAFVISLVIIALAWIAYRPVLGVVLLAIAIGGIFFAKRIASRKATAAKPA